MTKPSFRRRDVSCRLSFFFLFLGKSTDTAKAQDCPESNPLECGCLDNNQADYRGAIGVTQTGLQCQDWAVQTPHFHDLQEVTGAGLEDGAFCRNPDGDSSPWCYTTDPDEEWDHCDIPVCNLSTFKACEEANAAECGCRHSNQRDYRGTVNVTENGIPCQRWDQQVPHEHDFFVEDYSDGKLEENYCRNTFPHGKAWCYTIDLDHRWQFCNVAYCDSFKSAACAESNPGQCGCSSGNQADYRGKINITTSGKSCLPWTNEHAAEFNPMIYLDEGLEDGAYCRNPDNDVSPWCFVESIANSSVSFEKAIQFCDIPVCDNYCDEEDPLICGCGNLNRADYRGKLSVTREGYECQRWDSQFPHSHEYTPDRFPELEENYCRNPDGKSESGPWCFTSDPQEENRRQFCNVPYCGDELDFICEKPKCTDFDRGVLVDVDFASISYVDLTVNEYCTIIIAAGDDWSLFDAFDCREYRQIYHRCTVCEDGSTPGSDDENWCVFGDRCPTHIELNLTDIEIHDVCSDLNVLKQRRERPVVSDFCWKAEQVTSICPTLCGFDFDVCEKPYGCSDWEFGGLDFYDPLLTFDALAMNQLCSDISSKLGNDWSDLSVDDCANYHSVYHLCSFCVTTDPVPGFEHPKWCQFESSDYRCNNVQLEPNTNVDDTCDELTALRDSGTVPQTVDLCWRAEQVSNICPVLCKEIAYLGASTTAQKRGLVWATRVAACLSFVGALYLLITILRDPKLLSTVYHRLVVGMAIFDLVTAIAWSFASFPQDQMWIYGAGGNMGTCKAQGFFIQLGYTSVFYNVSLSWFYFVSIVKRWSETKLRKAEKYLHGAPIATGLALAFGAIPHYNFFIYGCHIPRYPDEEELWVVLLFILIPLGLSILVITGTMIAIYFVVRAQANRSRRWSLGLGETSSMKRKVLWQCFWYSLAFWVTWPIQFGVYVSTLDKILGYGFSIVIAIVAPLQGFSNFMVYVRPRLCNTRRQHTTKNSNQNLCMRVTEGRSSR